MHNIIFFLKKLFCKHQQRMIKTIYVRDTIYDTINDNDDLEDIPTFIKIEFCSKCGKIVKISDSMSTYESSLSKLLEFEKITNTKINLFLQKINNAIDY